MIAFDAAKFDYGQGPILLDLSVNLEPGGFYFLTGPSGSGKTTFLRLCYLDLQVQEGIQTLFGEDVVGLERDAAARMRQRIGVIPQVCRFLDHLSVRENVALPLDVTGRRSAQRMENVDDLLTWVGLIERSHSSPRELSGGEMQRAALARAVILSPDLVIADEPTGNVDREMGRRLLDLLVELNRMGRTILVATHDLDLIRATKSEVPTRVLRLSQGRIVQAGSEL
ncbi:cell division ATP-binding protein FtsE [Algicella marina]|uniref:ATP-binding cassette domain-containing protein n=1 Tax=Algicella marina TaxID=2683284 RepID=A0A6P1T2W1_9RHOB|nr:ATP-binding cassette domain-containing protein [Algicella marina]QHQ37058.1 ATP-binding cassette domain-containing protein [Algicella marina]